MYTLIIEDRNGRSAAEISFVQGSYTIGRVDGNDVVLPSSSVSRTHARIFVSNNKCYIDDLGSANGVLVDNNLIKERTEIRNGSKVRIGEYTLYLEYKDQSELNSGQDVLKTQIVSSDQSGYKIVRIGDKFAGEAFMLSEQNNTIGRTEDNYILLSDNSISRNHAKIINNGLTMYVVDLDSSNGTFVNNKKISSNSEHKLQPGDKVRFGNVSFVFVPASENVDIRQYAIKKGNDNRQLIIVFMAVIIVMCIVFCVIAIALDKKNEQSESEAEAEHVATQEEARAALDEKIREAEKLFNDRYFENAQNIVEELLKENSDHQKLRALNSKIEFELKNHTILTEGIKLLETKEYEKAIKKFQAVDLESVNYDTAHERIKETEHNIRLKVYNEARSICDEGTTAECISNLCEATLELKPEISSENARIEDTKAFMERTSKNKKSKYNAAAKRCLKDLESMF